VPSPSPILKHKAIWPGFKLIKPQRQSYMKIHTHTVTTKSKHHKAEYPSGRLSTHRSRIQYEDKQAIE
jgi:hypothetical protein